MVTGVVCLKKQTFYAAALRSVILLYMLKKKTNNQRIALPSKKKLNGKYLPNTLMAPKISRISRPHLSPDYPKGDIT